MKIFIDDGEVRFLIEESESTELHYMTADWAISKNRVIIITLEKEIEQQKNKKDIIKNIKKITKELIRGLKGIGADYMEEFITTIKFADLQKVTL